MNINRRITLLSLLALTGCTQWEKAGADKNTRDAELAICRSRGYERFPPNVVNDIEISYEYRFVTCGRNKRDCPDGPHYAREPEVKSVISDRNSTAREVTIDACMVEKGWHEKNDWWPW